MNFAQFYKIKNQSKKSSGFTLTELLVGAFVSTIVIGGAGWGLIQMLSVTIDNSQQTERRAEVNRAMDFVSDEIRRAKRVWTNYPDYTDSPGNADVANSITVLELQIPDVDDDGNDEFIAYYIKEEPNISSNWRGPQVLYRLGPPLDANGEYSRNDDGSVKDSVSNVLIDSLQKRTTPGCVGTIFPTPVSGEVPGFAVCLDNPVTIADVDGDLTDETAYETANLFFSGVFDSDNSSETYLADSKAFTRANEDVTVAPPTDIASNFTNNSGSSCSVQDNGVVCTQNTIVSVQTLPSAYSCDTVGNNWKMKTEVKIGTKDSTGNVTDDNPDILDENNSSAIVSLGSNESIQVISDPYLGDSWTNPDTDLENGCNNSSDPVDNTDSVKVSVLDITSNSFSSQAGFDDGTNQQDSVFEILSREGLVLTTEQITSGENSQYQIDDDGTTKTIKKLQVDDQGNESYEVTTDYKLETIDGTEYLLTSDNKYVLNVEKNQQLFLYLVEIGQDDPNNSGFDQQDNIVLVRTESS